MPIPVREFKARLSHYLGQVRAGSTIEISSHRRVIARVTGVPDRGARGVQRLLASGSADWCGGKPAGANIQLTDQGPALADIVREDRT